MIKINFTLKKISNKKRLSKSAYIVTWLLLSQTNVKFEDIDLTGFAGHCEPPV